MGLGGRSRARQDHACRHVAHEWKGYTVHASSDEPQYEIKATPRTSRHAQGLGAREAREMNRRTGDILFTIGHSTRSLASSWRSCGRPMSPGGGRARVPAL